MAGGADKQQAREDRSAQADKLARPAPGAKADKSANPVAADKAGKTEKPGKRTATASPAASAAAASAEKYLINVGLFADPNNARNAYTRLVDAGLPAQSQAFSTSKGERTRVRVGPFETRAEAETAADKIRALKLEAQVFKP